MIVNWLLSLFIASITTSSVLLSKALGASSKIQIKEGKNLVLVKPLNWVKVHLNKNDICGVLCDRHYEIKDYIRDYNKFNAIKNKI